MFRNSEKNREIEALRLPDRLIHLAYTVAYRGHLVFNFIFRPVSYGAYAAVWAGNKILLVKNSYKSEYTFPCGGISQTETATQAARRELQEEVGLSLPLEGFKKVYETMSFIEFKRDHIQFFGTCTEQDAPLNPDGREVIWAGFKSVEEALAMPIFPPVREYLLHCRNGQGVCS